MLAKNAKKYREIKLLRSNAVEAERKCTAQRLCLSNLLDDSIEIMIDIIQHRRGTGHRESAREICLDSKVLDLLRH